MNSELFQTLIENISDVIAVLEADGTIRYQSPSIEQASGYKPEELIGKNAFDFVHPDDLPNVIDVFTHGIEVPNNIITTQFRLRHKNGSWHYVEGKGINLLGNPTIKAVVFDYRDVTEHVQMEEMLRQSEERYRTIIEEMQDGYFEVDLTGNFTLTNEANSRNLGYSREELIGTNYRAHTAREDVNKVYKAFNQTYLTGQPSRAITFKMTRKDDSTGLAEISAFPLRNEKGEIIGFRGIGRDITEHAQIIETLRRSEEKYRTILEEIREGYWEVDLAGNFTSFNDAVCHLLRYSKKEMMGMNYRAYTSAEDVDKVYKAFNQVYRTGKPIRNMHYEIIRKDGGKRLNETSVFPRRDDKKEIIGFRGVSHDVTERVQMEETLRQSEERYRTILDEMEDNYFEVDLAGNWTFVNDANCRNLGYSKEELLGLNYRAIFPGEEAEKVFKAFNQAYLTGQPSRGSTFKVVRKDGSSGVGELSAFPMRNKKGEIIGFRGVGRDITKRMEMEESLRQSEEKYRTILEDMQDSYFEVDLAGNFTFGNPSFYQVLGYSPGELTGINYRAVTAAEDVEIVYQKFNQVYRTGIPINNLAYETVRKDGSTGYVEIAVTPIRNKKNEIIGFRGVGRDVTERTQIEEALRQSEEKYRTILEDMEESYYEDDLAGNFTFVNDAVCRVLGYSKEELIGMNYRVYTPPEEVEKVLQAYNLVYRTGEPNRLFTTTQIKKDGTRIAAECSVIPLRNENGEIIGFRGVGRDVTERIQIEEALRQSEEKYRTILESMEESYYEVDYAGNLTFFNDALCHQLGYSREEVMGMNYKVYTSPENVKEVFQAYNQVYREGKPIRLFDMKQIRKDGTRIVAENSIYPLRNEKGEVIGFRGVGRDITKRLQAEEALKKSEERYRTILEEMQEPYFEMDLAGRFTFFNDALCRRLGYSKEELMGMHYKVYTPPEDAKKSFEAFNRVYRTGEPARMLDRISINKDGTRNLSETSVLPLRNEQGEIIGFRGLTRDLTERKKAEEEKRQLEQKAQLASRLASVGELASGVAHEINNPLTGVIGYAHLLLARKDIPKDMRQDIEIINEGAQRVAGIVKKLLAFARQTRPEQRYVNMNELIHTTLDLRAYELASSNIKVALQLARDLPLTIADPGQLQQVFLNLIINAETEMRLAHDKGKLSIKTEQIDNTIRISFKDNGPGIPKENLTSIFDPFFTTREVGQGTGLGLSVCHGIVTEHRGRIWVESEPGKGATFIVELPITTEDKQLEMPEPVIEEPKKVAKAKILVVDDEPVIRQLVSQVLTEEGHQVDTMDNAADALKMVKNKRYRLILLDIKMPGMSGIELYKQFQKIAPSLTKRVAFITGDVMGKRTLSFLDKTKTPYMMKPFDAKQLKTEINRILARR